MTSDTRAQPEANPELILANWRNELDSADLYRYLAGRERNQDRAGLLREMAEAELRHARVMEAGLRKLKFEVPRHKVGFRTRALKTLARYFGAGIVYPLLQGTEIAGSSEYAAQDVSTAVLAPEERSHARTLAQISRPGAYVERWHRTGGGGTLRAAVFGVNDGLVSNLSLVMGFAGASANPDIILLAGLAGLLAGASSMAAGEYVSVRSQRELLERQIELEAAELSITPQEEINELATIYRAKGVPRAEAERLAQRLGADPEVALQTLVREELGLDPDELGSPYRAAISSFSCFSIGALLPVVPYFFGAATVNVLLSLMISGAALFTVGALVSIFTGRPALFSGGRQLAIGGVAAAITFALGTAIGVSSS